VRLIQGARVSILRSTDNKRLIQGCELFIVSVIRGNAVALKRA